MVEKRNQVTEINNFITQKKKEKLYRIVGVNSFFTQNKCLQIDIYAKVNLKQYHEMIQNKKVDVTQISSILPLISAYFFVFKIRKAIDKKQIQLPNNQIKEVPVFYIYDRETNTRKMDETFITFPKREVLQLNELLTDIYLINKDIAIDSSVNTEKIISNLASLYKLKKITTPQGDTVYSLNFFRSNKTVNIILMPPNQNFSTFGIQFKITPAGKEPYSFIIRDNNTILELAKTLEIATNEVLKRNIDNAFERFLTKIYSLMQNLASEKNIEDLPLEVEVEQHAEPFELEEELEETETLEVESFEIEPETFELETESFESENFESEKLETFEPEEPKSVSFFKKNTSFHKFSRNKITK